MIDAVQQELNMKEMGERAREAAFQLAAFTTEQKNAALLAIADALEANTPRILEVNRGDIEKAKANTEPTPSGYGIVLTWNVAWLALSPMCAKSLNCQIRWGIFTINAA